MSNSSDFNGHISDFSHKLYTAFCLIYQGADGSDGENGDAGTPGDAVQKYDIKTPIF